MTVGEKVTCPGCWGSSFETTTQDRVPGQVVERLFCTRCRAWTVSRPIPSEEVEPVPVAPKRPGLHLAQPAPAVLGGGTPEPMTIGDGPTRLDVWAWLLAALCEETLKQLGEVLLNAQITFDSTTYDAGTRWLQRFRASEYGTPPQELLLALQAAARGQ